SDFPDVDWVGQIEAETAEFLEQQRREKESAETREMTEENTAAAQAAAEEEAARVAAEAKAREEELAARQEQAATEAPARQTAPAVTANRLPGIEKQHMPAPTNWHLQAPAEEIAAYNAFIRAVNRGDPEEFKALGYEFLNRHPKSRLAPLLRWHFANKLYVYGEYIPAKHVLDPLVHIVDYHYPYALLLAARLDHAVRDARYRRLYPLMQRDYADHPIGGQVAKDLEIIGGGAQ
ncbi:MAG: hypothetical protein R6T89_08315, partial [Candidatus Syntrophosphaera sp.]